MCTYLPTVLYVCDLIRYVHDNAKAKGARAGGVSIARGFKGEAKIVGPPSAVPHRISSHGPLKPKVTSEHQRRQNATPTFQFPMQDIVSSLDGLSRGHPSQSDAI